MSKLQFAADYACPVHPEVVQAITQAAATYPNGSYGEDPITQKTTSYLRQYFGEKTTILYCSSGTAANRIVLQTLLGQPCNAVICTNAAHINNNECGALESLGHKILVVPTKDGKIHLDCITGIMMLDCRDVHHVRPTVLSIAQATEWGTVYSQEELVNLGHFARHYKLKIHVDGARLFHADATTNNLANFVANLSVLGADAITFGGTKNGGMLADAIIIGDPVLGDTATLLHKQQGQLCARTHVLAAEFKTLCTNSLGFKLAHHANCTARLLAKLYSRKFGTDFTTNPAYPVESNAVFLWLPTMVTDKLQKEVDFYKWGSSEGQTLIRLICSWNTASDDVHQFLNVLENIRDSIFPE